MHVSTWSEHDFHRDLFEGGCTDPAIPDTSGAAQQRALGSLGGVGVLRRSGSRQPGSKQPGSRRRGCTRRAVRGFTLMELTIALAMFMLIAGILSLVVAKAVASQRSSAQAHAVASAVGDDLEQITRGSYADLVDDTFVVPNACNPAILGEASQGCVLVGGRFYNVSYEVATGADSYGRTTTAADGVIVTAYAGLGDGVVITQSASAVAPFPGWSRDKIAVQARLSGDWATMSSPVYLLSKANPGVAVASATPRADGTATFRAPAGSCPVTDPCRVGLLPGADYAAADGHALAASSVLGAGSTVVLDESATTDVAARIIRAGRGLVRVEALPEGTTVGQRNDVAGSVCLWARFHDGYQAREVPFCNDDGDPGTVILDDYAPDVAQPALRLPVPAGVVVELGVDRSDGTCPVVAGQLGATASGWVSAAVCTSWTWGIPSDYEDEEGMTSPFVGADITLVAGADTEAHIVWSGPQGRPAAGYASEGTWVKPRAPQACSANATCTRFGSVPVEPDAIPGLSLWLDANAITGVAGGEGLSSWEDRSGHGNNVTQATAARQPTYTAAGLNGRPVLTMTAAAQQTMLSGTNFPAPFTVMYLARQTGGSNQRILSGVANNWLLGYHDGRRDRAYYAGWVNLVYQTLSDTAWRTYTGDGTGALSRVFSDNTLLASNSGGLAGPNGISLNGHTGNSELSDAQMAEVLIFNRPLTDEERAAGTAYLNTKWGTAATPETQACPEAHCFSTLNAAPVLTAPGGVRGVAITPSATTSFTLTAKDLEGAPASATLITAPTAGTLRHDGAPVGPGYVFASGAANLVADLSYDAPAGTAQRSFVVRLSDGVTLRDVRVALYPVTSAWQIIPDDVTVSQGGTVELAARMVGTDGTPLSGVVLSFSSPGGGASLAETSATTNPDGYASVTATFATAQTGIRAVTVSGPEGTSATLDITVRGRPGAATVTIAGGGGRQGDTTAVAVAVADAAGAPLEAAARFEVHAGTTGTSPAVGINTSQAGCRVPSGGSCQVNLIIEAGAAAGPYRLRTTVGDVEVDTPFLVEAAAHRFEAGRSGDPAVTLAQETSAVIEILVSDGSGVRLPGVTLSPNLGATGLTLEGVTASDASGIATITVAAAANAATGMLPIPLVGDGATGTAWVEVEGVTKTITPQGVSVPSGGDAFVQVLVTDAGGAPVPGAVVTFIPPEGIGLQVDAKASANAAGAAVAAIYAPAGTPSGTYFITALSPGFVGTVSVAVTVTAGV